MFPRWLSWLFLGVMAYMIYASSQPRQAAESTNNNPVPAINEKTYPALAEMMDGERWKRKINPDYAAKNNCELDKPNADTLALKVIEDVAGEGEGAVCGETIAIKLTVWAANGTSAYSDEFPLALGAREVAAGLDVGLLGIKPNGTRTLVLAPNALAKAKNSKPPEALLKAMPATKLAVITVTRLQ